MYPINFNIRGRPCLIIGGGHIALRKARRLLAEGAKITIISEEVCKELIELEKKNFLSIEKMCYDKKNINDYILVVTATGQRDIAEYVARQAKEHFFLYNAADFPSLGNCHIPSRFQTGAVMVTVSTEGKSPAVAKHILGKIQKNWSPFYGEWLERIEELRQHIKITIADGKIRECFWQTAFSEEIMSLVESGLLDEAEERLRHDISSIRIKP